MIGPGWLPRPAVFAASRLRKRRTLPYTPRRARRKPVARIVRAMNDQIVIFDRPAELPVATLVPRERRAQAAALVGALRNWLAARWAWLRPRTVPVLVATAGMFAVLLSADYLAHGHGHAIAPQCVIVHVAP